MGIFWTKKKLKITKREHAFEGFERTYNVDILIYFNPELLKDTESAMKNKLKEVLSELRRLKFVTTPVLVFEKIKTKIKQSLTIFIQAEKQK